jgi:hypothetical protein
MRRQRAPFVVGRRELISEASGRIDLYLVMLLFRS